MTKQFLTIGSDKIKLKPDNKDENPFRYCGEYYDKETEEVYLRARYYEPEVGRFLTRDTYTGEEDEPESLHLYAYCGYDGVNAVDPNGECYVIKYVYTPVGKNFKENQFVKTAIDAIHDKNKFRKKYKLTKKSKDMAAMLAFAEKFNGTGYTDYHKGNNPYLYSGTNIYKKGKYDYDGHYNSNLVDRQVGVFALINKIL